MSTKEVWLIETVLPCGLPTHNTIFVFDTQVGGSWWKWTGLGCSRFHTLDAVQDDNELLAGDHTGHVNRLLSGSSDLGAAISGRWLTKWHDINQPDTVKIFRAIHLQVDQLGAPLTVSWETDDGKASADFVANYRAAYHWNGRFPWNNAAGTVQNGMFWNAPVKETLIYSLPQSAIGRRIRFNFEEAGLGTPFRLLGYQLYYRIKRQRYQPEV